MAQCRHVNQTVRVSSHVDLEAVLFTNEPFASRYSCDRPECLEAAAKWVQKQTGATETHVVRLPRAAEKDWEAHNLFDVDPEKYSE